MQCRCGPAAVMPSKPQNVTGKLGRRKDVELEPEDEVRDEAEPEELPDYSPLRSCERQEWSVTRAFYAFLSLCAEKRFLFCFYFSGTRNPVSSVRKTKDIKII